MHKLRIAILHLQVKLGQTCYNRQLLLSAIAIAAGYGAELVVTGELIESGEDFWRTIYLNSIPGENYPFLETLKETARKYQINILFGRAYRQSDTGRIFSIYTHINEEGEVQAIYKKQVAETTEEGNVLTQGTELVVTNIDGLDVGLILGYNEDVQSIIDRYEEERVDLIIGGITPFRHPCNSLTFDTSEIEVPLILSNYNILRGRGIVQGESLALSENQMLRFCPICSEVIILDYFCDCEYFEVVNRVNVNQVLECR
ncbi:MAG: hypothetical protein E7231_02620 [Cellulosilyticum sp.]|nr:hypothetical protein [Cellulosilyticum sp.]